MSTILDLTARQDKPSDSRTYVIHERMLRTKDDDEPTSQASSTLISASTDTIRESMRSGSLSVSRQGSTKMIYIPLANIVLHTVSHSCASSSETSTKVVWSGVGSLQLPVKDWESLLECDMDLMGVEPSEHIVHEGEHCMMAPAS